MEQTEAIDAFAALAQPTRMGVYRVLVEHEPAGLPAGEVARVLKVQQNTMSSHLAILSRAGLVESRRQGRTVIYRAVVGKVREVADFLLGDCCGGRRELCEPSAPQAEPGAALGSGERRLA